jgi:hypothetical protein
VFGPIVKHAPPSFPLYRRFSDFLGGLARRPVRARIGISNALFLLGIFKIFTTYWKWKISGKL